MVTALEAIPDEEKRFEAAPLEAARELVLGYYEAINAQNLEALDGLTIENVTCDTQVTERLVGRQQLVAYLRDSNARCREHVFDIEIMVSADGSRAAAEFTVLGFPLADSNGGAAPDPGQTYRLPGGSFFEITDGRIVRISSYGESGRLAPGALAPQLSV